MTQVTHPAQDLGFDRSWISAAALQVVEGLQAAGFDGYLVGGCVRDLLLQRRPKDFDITTDASPEQVRGLFRRSRIIGRRFKIVHVRFGREVVEVATYRAKPSRGGGRRVSTSGRVVDDNVFGTIEQDAQRRDFTVNAMYYDPSREQVMDFLGGVKDSRNGVLRMIGEAAERFTEDPVRMLRALRFRAKLGMKLADGVGAAIAQCRALLEDVPAARLFDEALKMFHHGHAGRSWQELRAHRMTSSLFPLTVSVLDDPDDHADSRAESAAAKALIDLALKNTDLRVRQGKPVIPAFLFAVLLWTPFRWQLAHQRAAGQPGGDAVWSAGEAVFGAQSRRVSVPRRVSAAVMEIWEMQTQLERRRAGAVLRLLADKRFRAAYDFLVLRQQVGEVDEELAHWWRDIQACSPQQQRQWADERRAAHPDPSAEQSGQSAALSTQSAAAANSAATESSTPSAVASAAANPTAPKRRRRPSSGSRGGRWAAKKTRPKPPESA